MESSSGDESSSSPAARCAGEFFHTFNTLYQAESNVITSDRPPIEMVKLEDRLRTRFEGGLMADIQPPDFETRMAIIRNKASQLGMTLPTEVVEYIADEIKSNIRQIEGVVKRLTAYNSILDDNIDLNAAKRAVKDIIRVGAYIPTPDVIIEETARYYTLEPDDLRGQRRSKNTALARQIAMYLMRSLTNLSSRTSASSLRTVTTPPFSAPSEKSRSFSKKTRTWATPSATLRATSTPVTANNFINKITHIVNNFYGGNQRLISPIFFLFKPASLLNNFAHSGFPALPMLF